MKHISTICFTKFCWINTCFNFVTGLLIPFLGLMVSLNLNGQGSDVVLDEILIRGSKWDNFTTGVRHNAIDSLSVANNKSSILSELLRNESALHLKTYGNGMLATISIRGTSASHTTLVWNGLNINSPSLGLSDFSLLPLYGLNNLSIYYGGTATQAGSGAIGGAIVLENSPQASGSLISLQQTYGSFNSFFSGLTAIVDRDGYTSKTTLSRRSSENDFLFKNLTLPGTPEQRQENSEFEGYSLTQDFVIKWHRNLELSTHFWYSYFDKNIQPSMANLNNNDTQLDESYRVSTRLAHHGKYGTNRVDVGYIRDRLLYNSSIETTTQKLIGQWQIESTLFETIDFITGFQSQLQYGNTESYQNNEFQTDLFFLANYSISRAFLLNLNLRQTIHENYNSPFTPSIGFNWNLKDEPSSWLSLKGTVSRVYRIPTLNDRYWEPGGNLDLIPEKGWSSDFGTNLTIKNLKIETNLFYSSIQNWIVWIPIGNIWQPENLRQVLTRGIESKINYDIQLGSLEFNWMADYAYTIATNQKALNEFDRSSGKQLPFTPVQKFVFTQNLSWNKYYTNFNFQYTGKVFITSDNGSSLPGYPLLNMTIGSFVDIKESILKSWIKINNMTNRSYQNVPFRAMPGVNFEIGLNYELKI